ncbi:MAG: hypothetical protein M1826_000454 [Phylliscum demangeonii]|nr:MAG: hypothetical protein M1826_000454 [Phylliscum demangeonii]
MDPYGLLDQTDEDGLHKARLLTVEEKPFKRVTKRLLATNSLLSLPDDAAAGPRPKKGKISYGHAREDVLLDFAAFDSSMARVHFVLASNERERDRYAAEKGKIVETARMVRHSTQQLQAQLLEAQHTLAVRKTWDALTEKITSNRMLRPREDQRVYLDRLNAEIAELEKESFEYKQTWAERREQFGRIVKEGVELRRLIRDETEEVERREGMQGPAATVDGEHDGRHDEEEGEEGEVEVEVEVDGDLSMAGRGSRVGATLDPVVEGTTTMTMTTTTVPGLEQSDDHPATSSSDRLTVPPARTPHSRSPSNERRHPSPLPSTDAMEDVEEGEDTTMVEQGEIADDEDEEMPDGVSRGPSRTSSEPMSASPGETPLPETDTLPDGEGRYSVVDMQEVGMDLL